MKIEIILKLITVADPGFPRRRQPLILEQKPTIWQDFAENCIKMKEIGPRARVPSTPWICQWIELMNISNLFSLEIIKILHLLNARLQNSSAKSIDKNYATWIDRNFIFSSTNVFQSIFLGEIVIVKKKTQV